jgi:hypothetical protein
VKSNPAFAIEQYRFGSGSVTVPPTTCLPSASFSLTVLYNFGAVAGACAPASDGSINRRAAKSPNDARIRQVDIRMLL